MRTIAAAAAIFLVAVAAASGAGRQTTSVRLTQRAAKAPLPAGVDRKRGAFLFQVACPSVSGCVATGGYRTVRPSRAHLLALSERAGKWRRDTTPAQVAVSSLACPAIGSCVGAGGAGEQETRILSQHGSTWHASVVMLPNNPPQSFPILQSASCGSVGNCSAVGGYETANHPGLRKHALLVDESNGTWDAAFDAQLPPDAATAINPNQTLDLGGSLRFVSCPSPGNCTAVGSYTRKDSTDSMLGFQGWFLDENGGNWGVGISAQLPADARTTVDSRGGESPFMGFTGLSCPSIGNCTAVGGYVDKHGAEQGVILTERKGRWSRGIRAPIPPREIAANPPNSLNSPLTSVSCAAPNDCAAIGWSYDKSRRLHGLLLSERGGKWKASGLVLHAKAPGGIFLNSVDCGSRGNCVAIGYWGSHGKTYGLIVAERGGKWGRGIKAVLPKGAAASNKAHTFLNAVSCPAAGRCTAVGSYTDRSGANQGLILSLRFR